MFGCPRHLTENERKNINEGLENGAADPNPEISHKKLIAFLERAVNTHGLPANVLNATKRAKAVRETINYGPRMLSWADGRITLENCAIQPVEVDLILSEIPNVYEGAVDWACRNGVEGGIIIATSLGEADGFFAGPQPLYGGWCSKATGQIAEQMRQTLVTGANRIVFPATPVS